MRASAAFIALVALLPSCASGPAHRVQDDEGPVLTPTQRSAPPAWTVGFDARAFERSDLDDAGGNVAVERYAVRVERKWSLGQRSGWKLRFRHEQSDYDFARGLGDLSGLDDFDDAHETRAGASYWSAPEGGPSWFAMLNAISSAASGGDFSNSLYLKTFTGALWPLSETLNLGFGVFGRTALEDDASILVIPLFEWRIGENDKLGYVQSSDPGLGYTRKLGDALDFYVSLQFLSRQYRLDDDDVDDGALVDKEQSLRVGFLYDEGNGLDLDVFAGVARRELRIDADDDKVDSDDVDAGGMVGFSASFSF